MYIICLPVGTGRVVSVSVFSFSMNNQEYCTISVFHKYFASILYVSMNNQEGTGRSYRCQFLVLV